MMENFINSLSKYKPGTVQWYNEANRIFRSQTGRDLTREELRRLYSSYERTYKPNWTSPSTYSGKPGNVVFDNKPKTKSQAKRPTPVPKANVTPYRPQANFTMGQGSQLTPGYVRPQPVQPQLPSTNVLPQTANPNVLQAMNATPSYRVNTPQGNTLLNNIRAYKGLGNWQDVFKQYNPGQPSAGGLKETLNVRPNPVVNNQVIKRLDLPVVYQEPIKPNITKPVANNPITGFLGKQFKWISPVTGVTSGLASAPYFYNAFANPDATMLDRALDFSTGTALLAGIGNAIPNPVAQGVGKIGTLTGGGLSLIPRSYYNKPEVQQPVQQKPKEQVKETPQLVQPTPIADKVAYASNITTGTKLPVGNNYTPKGLSDTQNMIIRIAREEGVDPALALAVAGAESGFNASAVSPAGAIGLMQLMPETAKGLGVDPFVPEQNVRGGLRYLRQNMERYGNSLNLALAGYNAGPGAVAKYGGVPPYKETQNYINTIASNKKKWDSVLAGGNIGQPTAPTAKSNPIMNAFMPPAQAGTVYNSGQVGGTGSNPNYAIPEPQNDNSSYDMLLRWIKEQPKTSTNVNVSSVGGMGTYNPYQWLLPEELDKLKQLNDLYDNFSPEDYMNNLKAYAEWLQSARAKDQALGNISNTPTFSADGGYNPANIMKETYSLYNDRLKAEQELYDTLMKRADSRYMSYRYGLPFTSFKDNTGDVLQYIVKPTMEQQFKEKNRVPDTMMEMIKKENEGEITRKTDREKGRVDIAKTNNEWGNFRYPGMMNTLSSIEARNASDNQTKAIGYYTEALKTDAINQRIYDLTKLGLPAEMAGSMAMALGYLPTDSPQAKQIINYIMGMTGINANQLPQSLLNTGEGITAGDDSAMILQNFMGVGSGN